MNATLTIARIALGIFLIQVCGHHQALAHSKKPAQSTRSKAPDLSRGAIFTFKIGPDMPDFTFKIFADGAEEDKYGRPRARVRDIQVFRGAATKALQHLDGCSFGESEPPPAMVDWFRAEDLNFDGYQDIFLGTQWGATGNRYGCIWLYDTTTGRFKYSEEFSHLLCRYWLDPEDKTVFTFDRGGAAGAVHQARRYKANRDHLILIWSEDQDWNDDRKQFHCVVKTLRGTEMGVVRDAWGGGESEAAVPCDALLPIPMTVNQPMGPGIEERF